jgi:PIN domain nuclease of toxin-antitoxin system
VTQLAVVDTHALVWWAKEEHRRLGRRARRMFERVESGSAALFVPTLVLDEVGELARRGIIMLAGGLEGWTRALFSSARFFPAELSVDVVLQAESLRGIPEPHDRLIAATALYLGYPLVTKDKRIAEAGVNVMW